MKQAKKTFFERLTKFLGGLRFSFILIILLGGLAFQKAIIVQKTIAMEEMPRFIEVLNSIGINSPRIFSAVLITVMVFFVINLLLSTVRMSRKIKAKRRSAVVFKNEDAVVSLPQNELFDLKPCQEEKIISHFKGNSFRVVSESSEAGIRFCAYRRTAGMWGVLFFHLTFIFLLAGALMSMLTRYAGYAELTIGETFIEKRDNYERTTESPSLFSGDQLFSMRLDEIDLEYWKPWEVKQRANIVSLYDADGRFIGRQRMEINSPVSISGMNVYQGTRQGFIAELEVTDSEGTVAPGRVRFRLPDKPGERIRSFVTLPGTNLDLELELFTEKVGDIKGLEPMRSLHMATLLKVSSVEGMRRSFHGVVFIGSELSFEGLSLRFISLRPYSSFVTVQDYGVPLIFAGFVPLIIGLVVTYFWVPENYWGVINRKDGGCSVIIGATSERFRQAFRERFAGQMHRLREEISHQ